MDYICKLSKLSCTQNHDLSWIRNENATYVVCKQAVYLVKNNRVKKSRGDGEEKKPIFFLLPYKEPVPLLYYPEALLGVIPTGVMALKH